MVGRRALGWYVRLPSGNAPLPRADALGAERLAQGAGFGVGVAEAGLEVAAGIAAVPGRPASGAGVGSPPVCAGGRRHMHNVIPCF